MKCTEGPKANRVFHGMEPSSSRRPWSRETNADRSECHRPERRFLEAAGEARVDGDVAVKGNVTAMVSEGNRIRKYKENVMAERSAQIAARDAFRQGCNHTHFLYPDGRSSPASVGTGRDHGVAKSGPRKDRCTDCGAMPEPIITVGVMP